MGRIVSFLHAVVGASALLLACVAGSPAKAERSLGELKINYVAACAGERDAAERVRIQRNAMDRAYAGPLESTYFVSVVIARREYEAAVHARDVWHEFCDQEANVFFQALVEAIILAVLTTPPPERERPPSRWNRRPYDRPPASYPLTQSTAGANALLGIIGGIAMGAATQRPPAHVHPPGHRPYH